MCDQSLIQMTSKQDSVFEVDPSKDDDGAQIKKFLGLIRQASNAALITLIVDSIINELALKPHRIQLVIDFLTRELPKSESDFTILRVSEQLTRVLVMFQGNSRRIAEYLVNRYNVAAGVTSEDQAVADQVAKSQSRALDKFQKSFLVIPVQPTERDQNQDAYFKSLSVSSLMQSALVEQDAATSLTKLSASEFFDKLIRAYQPLLADTRDEAPKAKQDEPQGITKEEKKSATRKGIKSMVMGQLKDISSIKLSDFIDEKFLEELDDVDEVVYDGRLKQPLQNLVNELLKNSKSELIRHPGWQKRVKTQTGSVQNAAVLCSPLLAFFIELTNRMMNLEWRKRQAAASQLRALVNFIAQENAKKGTKIPDLEYFIVTIKENGFLSVQSTNLLPFASLVKNLLPRLLIFILKDNFSDFEGLKVLAPAREEAINLLSDIQYYSQLTDLNGGLPELATDLKNLLNLLPTIFISVENDNWYSRQNFFLLIKAMTLRNPPGSKTNELVLKMFSSLLVMSLPSVEDEPKVVITEIMQTLLPVFLQGEDLSGQFQNAQNTICQLIYNLTLNLQRSDEIEASSISVFQLVCKVFEMRDQYKCLADMQFSLDLATYFPFNFHKIEAVRFAYNQLISLYLAQPYTTIQTQDLRVLHNLVVQSIAMETSTRLIKLLLKVLQQIVAKFSQLNEPDSYLQYLQEDLLTETKMPAWIYDVSVQFDTFVFFESKQFESVENDYFKIVFRPSNTVEWEEFYMVKTENLTSAIAVMLAAGADQGFIFDQMCAKTMAYDEDQQTGGLVPRTLLNQSMMHLMLTLDKYLRIICKRERPLIPNQDGILDLCYIAELSSQFLHAQEKDVNVGECWQIDQMFASLHQFEDLCAKRAQHGYPEYNQLSSQCAVVSSLLTQLCQLQSFVFEQEFRAEIEKLAAWTMQTNDQQVISIFLPFQSNYHNLCFFALEYTSRLKSVSASILLSLAKISTLQEKWTVEVIFRLQADFISQVANPIIKSLLAQVNQERNYSLKKQSVKAVADLIFVGQHFKFDTICKKTLRVIFDMINCDDGNINAQLLSLIKDRDRALAYFFKLLIKQTSTQTIFEIFHGFIGALVLRPSWTAAKAMSDETLKHLKRWLATLKLLLTSIDENIFKTQKVSDQLKIRYVTLFQQEVCDLLSKVFSLALTSEHQRQYIKLLPEIFDLLFPRLTGRQRKGMIVVWVNQLELKQWIAFECLHKLLDTQTGRQSTSVEFMEYLPVFVIPVIQAIQNQHEIYLPGEHSIMKLLAKVIQLLPLNIASMQTSKEAKKGEEIDTRIQQGIDFLKVFANNQIVEDYDIIIPVQATLRQYQREGINWMAQLGKYNLNCALCDDMGLGKTLQSLVLIFNESKKTGKRQTSLIVCPTSLTYNWLAEVEKFFSDFKAVVIDGTQQQRDAILKNVENYDLVIVNYEKLKGCMGILKEKQFFYTVLDEAHKIKNSKSAIAQTVKSVKTSRKLALSGTPLQNRVSDLWSLFDFLMPGFLEEEPTFNKMYNKYLTANIKKMQEKLEDTQAFITALQSLKKRIAPFILRRTKEQVLKELPPKVIQDYSCRMPPVQASAHLQVEKHFPFQQVLTSIADKKQKNAGASILKNLILHRKVCNHPILLKDDLSLTKIEDSYCQSGKLIGLVELLVESEILSAAAVNNEAVDDTKNVSNDILGTIADVFGNSNQPIVQVEPHRALIFCQMSSFMQLIIDQVLMRFGVKFLQLKGSQSSYERVQTVNTFNSDSSYRVLILTTSVGGLGLTLTGADVVIFAEHDWNPMKDLQAMDRAHRIGQTRTVNVYRLILHDTLEEKIMSLQKFKENLAKSLIHARGDAISTDQVQNLELSDLLKSFEEHTSYQATTGEITAAGRVLPTKKIAKETGVMAKLTGLPGVPADMLKKASDDYNSNLDSIWQSADAEKY